MKYLAVVPVLAAIPVLAVVYAIAYERGRRSMLDMIRGRR